MSTHVDSTVATADGGKAFARTWRPVAWGRTVLTVLIGAALGSIYSLVTRPVTAAPPVELAASVAEQPIVDTQRRLFEMLVTEATVPDRPLITVADMVMLPIPPSKSLRDVAVDAQVAELPASMSFRSIATLSAPSPRMEAEVRALKGRVNPSNGDEAIARGSDKIDAVAAVWGFLAVGLGGSTATAATMRSTSKQPR